MPTTSDYADRATGLQDATRLSRFRFYAADASSTIGSVKRCAYLTMLDPGEFVTDYDISIAAMAELGWQVDTVPWRDASIDWDVYDAVYICTPWDYPQHVKQFMTVLDAIDKSTAHLVNDLSLVHWSLAKTYLRDLEARGAAIVPSLWFDAIDKAEIPGWFESLGSDTLVIKPVIGGNAVHTHVLRRPVGAELESQLLRTFTRRPFFVQPFMAKIQTEGEYSLFFFNGAYSHAIVKIPAAGDFRVQEEHGADIHSITASAELIEAGRAVLRLVEPEPVYVRADFVRDSAGRYLLMELELIEPSLYLRTDDHAAARFAAAFDAHIRVLEES